MTIYTPQHISDAKLDRIENRLWRARRNPVDGPMLQRFGYDHGNGLIYDSNGKCDLLFENTDEPRRDAAAILSQLGDVRETLMELLQGYRAAKKAGLLDKPIQIKP